MKFTLSSVEFFCGIPIEARLGWLFVAGQPKVLYPAQLVRELLHLTV